MKKCSKCDINQPIDSFYKNKRKKDGLQDYCKACKKESDRKFWVSHKDKWSSHYDVKRRERVEWFKGFKATLSCKKCGDNRYYILDFHHLDPSQKDVEISTAMGSSKKRVLEEVKKCIPLCRNCHAEFHHLERNDDLRIEEYLKKS